MAARKNKGPSAQLPAAPLTEVVFELRWGLQPAPPPLLSYDPMLIPTLQRFTTAVGKLGFPHKTDIVHPSYTGPYGVVRRFFRDAESPFPLLQIGPGIFAANDSAKYRWTDFRSQVINGVKALLAAYPTDLDFPLTPNYLELRYVDVFTKDVIQRKTFFEFASHDTSSAFSVPEFFNDKKKFWGDPLGNIYYQHALRDRKDSFFSYNMGIGKNEQTKEEAIQLMSRVVSSNRGAPTLKTPASFLREIGKWLDFAHDIASPFFQSFVKPELMKKFEMRP